MTVATRDANKLPFPWRPMAVWAASILLVLGMVWILVVLGIPTWKVRTRSALEHEQRWKDLRERRDLVFRGPDEALRGIRVYLFLPKCLAPYKSEALLMSSICGRSAIPLLIKHLQQDSAEMRMRAAYALAQMGPSAAEAVPWLTDRLTDSDKFVRFNSARALCHISPESAQPAVTVLAGMLSDSSIDPQWICQTLELLGPRAMDIVPTLNEMMNDRDESVRSAVAEALRKIRGVPVKGSTCAAPNPDDPAAGSPASAGGEPEASKQEQGGW